MWRKMTDEEYTLWKTIPLSLRKQAQHTGISHYRIFRITHDRSGCNEEDIEKLLSLTCIINNPTLLRLDIDIKNLEIKIQQLKHKQQLLKKAKRSILTAYKIEDK